MKSGIHACGAAALVVALSGIVLLVADAYAQSPTPGLAPTPGLPLNPGLAPGAKTDPASEATELRRLAAQLATQRVELERERRRLATERARISAIDQPASTEQLTQWNDLYNLGTQLGERVNALEGLVAALTPQTLQAIALPAGTPYRFAATNVGLASTTLEVNLRDAPDGVSTKVLPADTLVIQVAAEASGQWSVVVTPGGAGFLPSSMLKRVQ